MKIDLSFWFCERTRQVGHENRSVWPQKLTADFKKFLQVQKWTKNCQIISLLFYHVTWIMVPKVVQAIFSLFAAYAFYIKNKFFWAKDRMIFRLMMLFFLRFLLKTWVFFTLLNCSYLQLPLRSGWYTNLAQIYEINRKI